MAKDYYVIGSSPNAEECVQVSTVKDYMTEMTHELKRYKELLERMFPVPHGVPAKIDIKWFDHDFGRYGEVVVIFDDENLEAIEYAGMVEDGAPDYWEGEAK